jgi:hypothetical protein
MIRLDLMVTIGSSRIRLPLSFLRSQAFRSGSRRLFSG